MKNKTKQLLINTLLVLTVFFLLWVGYVGFIGGPAQAYKESDRYYMEAIADQRKLDSARFIERYALDKVYYIIEAEIDGVFEIAWFDEDFKSFETYGQVKIEDVYPIADELGIKHDRVGFGVFKNELVYVLKDKDYNEIYVDINELEIIELGGGN